MAGESDTRGALSLPAVLRLLAVLIACLRPLRRRLRRGRGTRRHAGAPRPPRPRPRPTSSCPRAARTSRSPRRRTSATIEKPDEKLDKSKTYIATVSTTCGDFEITLDSKQAPITGGSFKYLADQKFFDGLTFHRIVAGLRDPGRRSGRRRLGRSGLHRRRGAAQRPHLRRGHRRDGEDAGRAGGRVGLAVLRRHRRRGRHRYRPTTRCSGRSRRAWRSRRRSAPSRPTRAARPPPRS